ncbi:Probable auxin efflux carrier component 8 [Linum grandiflorum]
MITWKDIYDVLAAIVPLYVAMMLAYGSVKWWKIFTPDQCSGINRFVAVFAVPLLSFHFISLNDPYAMDYRFIAADSLQKVVILAALFLWQAVSKGCTLEWVITIFSLATLPNTLVMGIPLLRAMYGDFSGNLMVQIVVLQSVIWYTLMLFMFEYRGAKLLISEQFPETAGVIWSLVSYRWNIQMPSIVKGSISILSDAGLGMAMFSLGLFMALQPKIIACGKRKAAYAMAVRFLTGPAVICAVAIPIGLRGTLLHVAIVQAALPQGIVPFVFAKEYNVHADILSTGVIFGMLIALPITILYYVLLGL